MEVSAWLYGSLRRRLLSEVLRRSVDVSLAEGDTARDLMDALGVSPEARVIVVVNGSHGEPDTLLAAGDLMIMAPLAAEG